MDRVSFRICSVITQLQAFHFDPLWLLLVVGLEGARLEPGSFHSFANQSLESLIFLLVLFFSVDAGEFGFRCTM
jgi:hypothetical protein